MSNRVVDGRWMGVFEESAMPTRKAAHADCRKCGHEWQVRGGYVD